MAFRQRFGDGSYPVDGANRGAAPDIGHWGSRFPALLHLVAFYRPTGKDRRIFRGILQRHCRDREETLSACSADVDDLAAAVFLLRIQYVRAFPPRRTALWQRRICTGLR